MCAPPHPNGNLNFFFLSSVTNNKKVFFFFFIDDMFLHFLVSPLSFTYERCPIFSSSSRGKEKTEEWKTGERDRGTEREREWMRSCPFQKRCTPPPEVPAAQAMRSRGGGCVCTLRFSFPLSVFGTIRLDATTMGAFVSSLSVQPPNQNESTQRFQTLWDNFEQEEALRTSDQGFVLLGTSCAEAGGGRKKCLLQINPPVLPFGPDTDFHNIKKEILKVEATNLGHQDRFYKLTPTAPQQMRLELIFPAQKAEIDKRRVDKAAFLFWETPRQFRELHEPTINPKSAKWVQAIVDGKSEQDRVLCKGQDFVMLADYGTGKRSLEPYCSTKFLIVYCRDDVRCLRDLRQKHVPVLRRMWAECTKWVLENCSSVRHAAELQFFVHYVPSYYWFHVHVTHATNPNKQEVTVGRGHFLEEIIAHLEKNDEHYAQATLPVRLGSRHKLHKAFLTTTEL